MCKFLSFLPDRIHGDSQEELAPYLAAGGNSMSPVGSWSLSTSCDKPSTRTKQDDINLFS